SIFESAQIPTFVGLPANTPPTTAYTSVRFAPQSNVLTASPTAPVPRFRDVVPPNDCQVLDDCDASYFPKLRVDLLEALTYVTLQNAPSFINTRVLHIVNEGGGVLQWKARIIYNTQQDWL